MTVKRFLEESIINTISYEFVSGSARNNYEPHQTEWRIFPYAVIVCAFDSVYECKIMGEASYIINPGEAVIVPAGITHKMNFKESGHLNYLHIKYTIFNSIDVFSFFEIPRVISNSTGNKFCSIVDEFAKKMLDDNITLKDTLRLKGLSLAILNILLEQSAEKKGVLKHLADINTIIPVLEYINRNLDTRITRKTLADMISLSETRFHYVFKEIMNVSPMKYLRNERLQKAYILISTTNLTFSEISVLVGYSDYSNFVRQFKDKFGKSPTYIKEINAFNF